jgi:S1-C subfamily serine protease
MQTVWEQLSKEVSDAVARAGRSVVAVDGRAGHTSSGIIFRPDLVLTANHTVGTGGASIIVENGTALTAKLVGRAAGAGVALLRLDQQLEAAPAEFADTASLAVGQLVVAVARTRRGNIVASAGILGGLMGEWQPARVRIDQFIRPDLTLYPGFSGGPLISWDARILGMTTGGLLRGKPITIPASTLVRTAEALLAKGHIGTPYIGLVMQPVALPEPLRKASGLEVGGGLLVMHAEPGAPADTAGLLLGDILVDVDGHACEDIENLHEVLAARGVGHEIKVIAIRGGMRTESTVKIGERPLR